jgi:hypothetical protein
MVKFRFPSFAKDRGPGFWLKPANLWASRRFLRRDDSNAWREAFGPADPPASPGRSKSFADLLAPGRLPEEGFRFVILGDTGEGDRSQYSLLPLLRGLKPDFMVIVGDLANPAGRIDDGGSRDRDDYLAGFFEPYRDLRIPIWSVPGNHEYYAKGRGREYFDSFCTRAHVKRWEDHGLRFVPQPGTYWELKSPGVPFVLLGVDTGMAGRLDGYRRFWRTIPGDARQHAWLEERLSLADREGRRAVVLFHIPALAKQKSDKAVRLKTLYRILAAHRSVSHVVCGHDHNYQEYAPSTFARFAEREAGAAASVREAPVHIVAGGGGSALHGTDYPSRAYPAARLFPSAAEWREHASLGNRIIARIGLGRTPVGRISALLQKDALADADEFRYLSFLLVDWDPRARDAGTGLSVRPVFMTDLRDLFAHLQDGVVDIMDPDPSLDQEGVRRAVQNPLETGRDDRGPAWRVSE